MAHRATAIYESNGSGDMERIVRAHQKSLADPRRLTESERSIALADYYMFTAVFDKAVVVYRTLLENDPNDRQALNDLGLAYIVLGEYARAEPLLRRAIALDSAFWQPYINLMRVQVALGRPAEARVTGEILEKRVPGNYVVGMFRVLLSSSGGDYRDAEAQAHAFLDQQRAVPRTRAGAARLVALIAAARGRVAAADRNLRVEMDAMASTGDADGYIREAVLLAFLHLKLRNDTTRALAEVRDALVRYPLDSLARGDRPYRLLISLYALAGDAARARALLGQYERVVTPEIRRIQEAESPAVPALIAVAEGRYRDAIAEYHRREASVCGVCFSMDVVGRTFFADFARVYELVQEPDSAIVLYERHLAIQSVERLLSDAFYLAGTHQRLGELYEARGDRETAAQHYARFVELWKDSDPELRPAVAEARRRLADLSRGSEENRKGP